MNPSRLKRRPDKLLDAPDPVCSTGCTGEDMITCTCLFPKRKYFCGRYSRGPENETPALKLPRTASLLFRLYHIEIRSTSAAHEAIWGQQLLAMFIKITIVGNRCEDFLGNCSSPLT